MLKNNSILIHDQFNCIQNMTDKMWVLLGSILCQIIEQLRPKSWYTLEFIIICVSNATKCCHFHTEPVQLYDKQERQGVSVVREQIMSVHGAATAKNRESLGIFLICDLYINIMCSQCYKIVKKDEWQVLFGRKQCLLMDQLRPKTGDPLDFCFCHYNHMLLNFHYLLVLIHILCSNTTFSLRRH